MFFLFISVYSRYLFYFRIDHCNLLICNLRTFQQYISSTPVFDATSTSTNQIFCLFLNRAFCIFYFFVKIILNSFNLVKLIHFFVSEDVNQYKNCFTSEIYLIYLKNQTTANFYFFVAVFLTGPYINIFISN